VIADTGRAIEGRSQHQARRLDPRYVESGASSNSKATRARSVFASTEARNVAAGAGVRR
jgi:hypothetical protein